jgi:hypothetical protein
MNVKAARILPEGTTAGMSMPQNLALTAVLILSVVGVFTVIGFASLAAKDEL